MAYADQEMSRNRLTAFIIVAAIHVVVGYALVTGLAYSAAKQIIKRVTTVDIKKDEEKKPPPPPPPPKNAPPPPQIVAPPPPINIAPTPVPVETRPTVAPVAIQQPTRSCGTRPAKPKGDPSQWVTTDDYPPRAAREMRGGVASFRLSVGPDGRVTGCEITSSSHHADLDAATCKYATMRGRFAPGVNECDNAPVSSSYAGRVQWLPPTE